MRGRAVLRQRMVNVRLLVALPVIMASMYAAYCDIYY
jgi:ABC-type proline/glycine betaine transport system permease subunit